MSTKPPTEAEAPCTAVAGPGMILTDSTILKSIGMPSPLSPILWRIPFMNTSEVKEGLLGNHVHETADVGRGALHRGRGTGDDIDRLDDIEVDRHAVAALADRLQYPIHEHIRGLAADAGVRRRPEVGVRVGARGQLAELRGVLDVDDVHLLARDDRHVARHIEDVVR